MTSAGSRPLLFNPLPVALAHYEDALAAGLEAGGVGTDRVRAPFESGGLSRVARLRVLRTAVAGLWSALRHPGTVVVLWPVLGLLDVPVWRLLSPRGARRLVVVHDPVPLRPQRGCGRLATWLAGRVARDGRIEVVTHTALARDALARRGLPVSWVLPHPVLPRRAPRRFDSGRPVVLVAGQYKPSRDTALLRDLGAASTALDLRIVGRGWPEIPGWTVEERFVSEAELDAAMAAAGAVLVPYRYYFQSGIAARACELGVPVVARRHEFIASLYGAGWPGFVEEPAGDVRGWVRALERTLGATPPGPGDVAARAGRAWAAALTGPPPVRSAAGGGRGRAA
ncbi:MAG: glycosyltransferase [Nocardioidaceae bacterium]|nr:glycosyltransferase [Nocardioidaceae bacterium]